MLSSAPFIMQAGPRREWVSGDDGRGADQATAVASVAATSPTHACIVMFQTHKSFATDSARRHSGGPHQRPPAQQHTCGGHNNNNNMQDHSIIHHHHQELSHVQVQAQVQVLVLVSFLHDCVRNHAQCVHIKGAKGI